VGRFGVNTAELGRGATVSCDVAERTRPRRRVPARLSRRAGFAVVAFAFVVNMLGTTLPTPLYGRYRQSFGLSELTITVVYSTYAIGVIAALLLFGNFSDRIGRRRMLLPALVASALSAVVFLLAHGLGLLLVGRVLSGLSAGVFTGTATATLVDLAPEQHRGRATLTATVANMGGLGLGPLLSGVVSQTVPHPIRTPYLVNLILVVAAIALVAVMPEPVEVTRGARPSVQGLRVPDGVRTTFTRAAIAACAGFAVLGLFTAVAPAFVVSLGHTSRAGIGAVVFAVFVASAAGQLALERIPAARALPGGCVGLIAGMAVLAVGLAAASLPLIVAGGVLAGFGQGLSFRAGLAAINAETPAQQRGAVASSFFVVAYVAISIPIVGEGVLAQTAGLRTAGLVFAGLVAALSATVLVLLLRRMPGAGTAG
jgi:MFS family permease